MAYIQFKRTPNSNPVITPELISLDIYSLAGITLFKAIQPLICMELRRKIQDKNNIIYVKGKFKGRERSI